MSYINEAAAGLEDVKQSRWLEAARKLSIGIKQSQNPAWLIGRSQAYVGLKRYKDALDDANAAWHAAYERNRRPFLAEAQYRRAVAFFRLEEYANADACCVFAMRLSEGGPAIEKDNPVKKYADENGFHRVTAEMLAEELRALEASRGLGKGNGMKTAMASLPEEMRLWYRAHTFRTSIVNAMDKLEQNSLKKRVTALPKPPITDVKEKDERTQSHIRIAGRNLADSDTISMQDYQLRNEVVVSLFSRDNEAEKIKVEFFPYKVRFNALKFPNGDERPYELDLWEETVPNACSYVVTPHKVELRLAKKTPKTWPQVRGSPRNLVTNEASGSAPAAQPDHGAAAKPEAHKPETQEKGKGKEPQSAGPSYPSSSRTGPKNWDTIDLGADSDEEKDVNLFFKQLYKNATPEQQRAMMKSFTESNGTTLSTDWSDVKDRKVETVPPDGVEAKEWK